MHFRVKMGRGLLYHKYMHWEFMPVVHPFLELSYSEELSLYLVSIGTLNKSTVDVAGRGTLRHELSTSALGRLLFEHVDKTTKAARLLVKTRKI